MAKIIDILDDKIIIKLYSFTKQMIEGDKDLTIVQAMQQDSYKRIKRRIRQIGWKD